MRTRPHPYRGMDWKAWLFHNVLSLPRTAFLGELHYAVYRSYVDNFCSTGSIRAVVDDTKKFVEELRFGRYGCLIGIDSRGEYYVLASRISQRCATVGLRDEVLVLARDSGGGKFTVFTIPVAGILTGRRSGPRWVEVGKIRRAVKYSLGYDEDLVRGEVETIVPKETITTYRIQGDLLLSVERIDRCYELDDFISSINHVLYQRYSRIVFEKLLAEAGIAYYELEGGRGRVVKAGWRGKCPVKELAGSIADTLRLYGLYAKYACILNDTCDICLGERSVITVSCRRTRGNRCECGVSGSRRLIPYLIEDYDVLLEELEESLRGFARRACSGELKRVIEFAVGNHVVRAETLPVAELSLYPKLRLLGRRVKTVIRLRPSSSISSFRDLPFYALKGYRLVVMHREHGTKTIIFGGNAAYRLGTERVGVLGRALRNTHAVERAAEALGLA